MSAVTHRPRAISRWYPAGPSNTMQSAEIASLAADRPDLFAGLGLQPYADLRDSEDFRNPAADHWLAGSQLGCSANTVQSRFHR